jgi:RNA polymerase sigma factor (sigma-70 family)
MSELAATGVSGPGVPRSIVSDDRLARRATKGDRRAFAAIYRRYHQDIYRFCLAIVGNSQDAQDALQNTMVKVLGALPGEKREIKLKPWLYRIAHNESIEVVRKRRAVEELAPEQEAAGPGLAEEAALRERLRRLIADVGELPERQKATLLMRELGGLGFGEIADALGTSQATARQTLYEARLGLREMEGGREMSCDAVTRALSDGDGRVTRRRDIRAHLRGCQSCRRFGEEIEVRRHDLAAIAPLPLVAATGLLHGILGGGTAKALGATAALKAATAVAVVAVVGVSADRSGLVDLGLPGGGHQEAKPAAESTAAPAGSGNAPSAAAGSAAARQGAAGKAAAAGSSHSKGGTTSGVTAVHGGGRGGTTPGASSSPSGQAAEHPHGRGHEKQHPAASAHGQETAAAHNGAHGGGHDKPEHPSHPVHPAHPAHPAQPAPPAPPEPPAPAPEQKGGGSAVEAPASEGSSAEHPDLETHHQAPAETPVPPSPRPELGG